MEKLWWKIQNFFMFILLKAEYAFCKFVWKLSCKVGDPLLKAAFCMALIKKAIFVGETKSYGLFLMRRAEFRNEFEAYSDLLGVGLHKFLIY